VIRRYNILGALAAVVVVIVAAASFALPWYHHYTVQSVDYLGHVSHEHVFYLHGYATRLGHSALPGWDDLSPWSTESLDSFTDMVSALVALGLIFSIALAVLVLMGYKRAALLAGALSVVFLAGSALVFYFGFGNALPSDYDYVSFFSDTTRSDGLITTHDVWGPLAGWWLVIAAAAIQCFTLLVTVFSERR